MRKFEIWESGFSIQGNSAQASLLSTEEANTWDEAVEKFIEKNPGRISINHIGNKKIYTNWGCVLHDNETDARKSFG